MKQLQWEKSVIGGKIIPGLYLGIPVGQKGVSRPVTALTETRVQDVEKAQAMSIIAAQQGMLGSYDSIIITHCNMC